MPRFYATITPFAACGGLCGAVLPPLLGTSTYCGVAIGTDSRGASPRKQPTSDSPAPTPAANLFSALVLECDTLKGLCQFVRALLASAFTQRNLPEPPSQKRTGVDLKAFPHLKRAFLEQPPSDEVGTPHSLPT
ncbi:hypothetical protein NDU88_001721 [Pleurodeles waltl]|uniref:Uncharacterized protein n=1 Tax=Pleurodeles waltl TaxID=8319 RepID=A0AAV7LYG3_PLEWA|nr:hypothetical protein NDU88_001721 [Pleurodeles waltl]